MNHIPNGTYDDSRTGDRYSFFNNALTATWDKAHLKRIPWGFFPEMPRRSGTCLSCGAVTDAYGNLPCGH